MTLDKNLDKIDKILDKIPQHVIFTVLYYHAPLETHVSAAAASINVQYLVLF